MHSDSTRIVHKDYQPFLLSLKSASSRPPPAKTHGHWGPAFPFLSVSSLCVRQEYALPKLADMGTWSRFPNDMKKTSHATVPLKNLIPWTPTRYFYRWRILLL